MGGQQAVFKVLEQKKEWLTSYDISKHIKSNEMNIQNIIRALRIMYINNEIKRRIGEHKRDGLTLKGRTYEYKII